VVEFAIAIAAGLAAGSIALIGFGADSLIEALAGGVVLWCSPARGVAPAAPSGRHNSLIAVSFFLLPGTSAPEALRTLVNADSPR